MPILHNLNRFLPAEYVIVTTPQHGDLLCIIRSHGSRKKKNNIIHYTIEFKDKNFPNLLGKIIHAPIFCIHKVTANTAVTWDMIKESSTWMPIDLKNEERR